MPASVDDLQLVVEGMQQQADEQLAEVAGATFLDCKVGGTSRGTKHSAGWGGSTANVPATGRYRVLIAAHGTDSYSNESLTISVNGANVYSGTAADISGYKAVTVMSEFDFSAGTRVNVTSSGAYVETLAYVIQRIE